MRSYLLVLLFVCLRSTTTLKVGVITEDSEVPAAWRSYVPTMELIPISLTNSTSFTHTVCASLEDGVQVLLDSTSSSDCAQLKHISSTAAVPVMFLSGCSPSPTTISMSASASEIQAIVHEATTMLRWGAVGIITDRLSDVSSSLLRSQSSQGKLLYYWEGSNYSEGLSELEKSSVYRILVSIPAHHVSIFIYEAISMGMGPEFTFFFTTPMKKDDLEEWNLGMNIKTGIWPSMYAITYPSHREEPLGSRESLVLDGLQVLNHSLDSFPIQSNQEATTPCQHQKVWPDLGSIMHQLADANTEGYTGNIEIEDGQRILKSLHITYAEVNRNGGLSLEDIGEWRKDGEIIKRSKRAISKELVVTTLLEEPYMMINEDVPESQGNDHFQGFMKDLLDMIFDKLQARYTIRLVADGKYGNLDPDTGRWSGMLGEVFDGTADLAAAPLTHTASRNRVFDFTKGFLVTGLSAVYLRPGSSISGSWVFLSAFSPGLWLCILAGWGLTSLVLYILGRVSPYEDVEESDELTMENCLWFTFTSMLFRRWIPLQARSSRFLLTLWWWFSLIMLVLYASLSGYLFTNQIMDPPMVDANDLLESGIPFGTLKSGSTYEFFKVSKKSIHQKMSTKMSSEDLHVKSYADGLTRVSKGDYAFIMETAAADYAISQDCTLTRLPTQIHTRVYSIAMRKGSVYKNEISHAVLALEEDGSIAALYDKWWNQDKECVFGIEGDKHLKSINVFSVGGILITYLLGLIASVCFGFGENFYEKYRGNKGEPSRAKNKQALDIGEQFRQLTQRDQPEAQVESA